MGLRLGRYETIRAIASGGMATVHLGRAVGAGGFERLVALKVLHPHIETEPDFIAMFLDEARLAAQIRHPNVVATIDVSSDPLYLVMEYVEGPSLHVVQRELRKQQKVVPLDIALRLISDVLAGLHAAHELTAADGSSLGLVHRDVTPHNALIGTDGITRITDFGVARAEARLSSTRGGQVKGKLAYMSPEQVRSDPVDRRSDVYAAGVVLHELLTNRPLFAADNEAALVVQVAAGASKPPRAYNPEVPEAIDAVCVKALSTDANERYATASDFVDALEEAARSAGVHIASNKAVANFVKLLSVHEAASSGRGDRDSSSGSHPSSPSGRQTNTPVTKPQPAESSTSSGIGAVVDDVEIPRNAPPWRIVAAAAAAVVVLIGLYAILSKPSGQETSTSNAAPAQESSTVGTTAKPGVTTAAPEKPAVSTSPSSEPAASATATAAATGSGARPGTTGKPPKTTPSSPGPGNTAFRPGGL